MYKSDINTYIGDRETLLSSFGVACGFGLFALSLFFGFVPLGSFGKKRKVGHQDKKEDITDILTSEGEEGWLEKVLKKVKHKAINVT